MKNAGSCFSPSIATTEPIDALLSTQCVVAVGVSGGKDSHACAVAVSRHLDSIAHAGPRVLVHSDLGRVEWRDSLPACERLASALGWELLVVRRQAGDMLARWEARWRSSIQRYADLSCVKLILPWSTPQMRFCTSEMKVDQITSALKKRFPGQAIVNASGIRRQESPARARMPIAGPMPKLQRRDAVGMAWNPIIEWSAADVWRTIEASGVAPHEAYARYGVSRVSCAFCIMSAEPDLRAAAGCEDNVELYRSMVDLEARSTFAFQGARWLADVAPQALPEELSERVSLSKVAAQHRQAAELEIPGHLLYTAGWPEVMPTPAEADLLASVRQRVSVAVGFEVHYTRGCDVSDRYSELMRLRAEKGAAG